MRLTIYSRPGCHLCDEMKAVVTQAIGARGGISFDVIDISNDTALLALYGLEVPVLMIDGTKAAKYRITKEALARALAVRR